MWSHKIWVEKPPKVPPQNINVADVKSRSIHFADQESFEAWCKQDSRIPVGWLVTYIHNQNAKEVQPASIKLVIAHQCSLNQLAYSYNGLPKYFLCADITPDYKGEYALSYESESIYRPLTEDEMKWTKDNVVVQNHIKDCLDWYKRAFE